jgi:hypothetical protein
MFIKERWVSLNVQNLLWLPSDYWPSYVSIRGNIIACGYEFGRVSFAEFVSKVSFRFPLASSLHIPVADDVLLYSFESSECGNRLLV